jgi:hypothetical protein
MRHLSAAIVALWLLPILGAAAADLPVEAKPSEPQHAVLREEDNYADGTVKWSTMQMPVGTGRASLLALRADVEIPARGMGAEFLMYPNTDESLLALGNKNKNVRATHVIDVHLTLAPEVTLGGSGMPGIIVGDGASSGGVGLDGFMRKISEGFYKYAIALDVSFFKSNRQLLTDSCWIGIAMQYADGRRAGFMMEKGKPGERAFATAFRAWGDGYPRRGCVLNFLPPNRRFHPLED